MKTMEFERKYLVKKQTFLARSEKIGFEVIGHRRHCKRLCGEMEISCQLEYGFFKKKNANETLEGNTRGLAPEDANKRLL